MKRQLDRWKTLDDWLTITRRNEDLHGHNVNYTQPCPSFLNIIITCEITSYPCGSRGQPVSVWMLAAAFAYEASPRIQTDDPSFTSPGKHSRIREIYLIPYRLKKVLITHWTVPVMITLPAVVVGSVMPCFYCQKVHGTLIIIRNKTTVAHVISH